MPYRNVDDRRASFRRWYQKNGVKHIKNVRRREKQRKVEYKKKLLDMHGGQCTVCGYDTCPTALEFHHKDAGEKQMSVGSMIHKALSWERIKAEAAKCTLLCANCHREWHDEQQKRI